MFVDSLSWNNIKSFLVDKKGEINDYLYNWLAQDIKFEITIYKEFGDIDYWEMDDWTIVYENKNEKLEIVLQFREGKYGWIMIFEKIRFEVKNEEGDYVFQYEADIDEWSGDHIAFCYAIYHIYSRYYNFNYYHGFFDLLDKMTRCIAHKDGVEYEEDNTI